MRTRAEARMSYKLPGVELILAFWSRSQFAGVSKKGFDTDHTFNEVSFRTYFTLK